VLQPRFGIFKSSDLHHQGRHSTSFHPPIPPDLSTGQPQRGYSKLSRRRAGKKGSLSVKGRAVDAGPQPLELRGSAAGEVIILKLGSSFCKFLFSPEVYGFGCIIP
jgi:hypothetical protein